MNSTPDPTELWKKLVELGEAWADADAAASLLEETRRSVLAEIALHSDGKSVAERETVALSMPAYRDHVRAMVEARRIANKARVNYRAAETWCDMARTAEATKRMEMGMR